MFKNVRFIFLVLLSLIIICFSIYSPSVASAASFKITDLGTLGGPWSHPYDMNNSGEVVGSACTDSACSIHHAFLYSDQMMIDLGTLGEPWSEAVFINDSGKIIGTSFTPLDPNDLYTPYTQRSFLYDNSILVDLGTLGGSFVGVAGINGVSQIVGSSGTLDPWSPCDDLRAFVYSGGNMIPLIPDENVVSRATGINDLGQIIGYAHVAPPPPGYTSPCYFRQRAFLYDNGSITYIEPFGANYWWSDASYAKDINKSGQIIGSSSTNSGDYHAFLYHDGTMTDIGSFEPVAINDAGQVIGNPPILYNQGEIINLGTITGDDGDIIPYSVKAINNSGRVIGQLYRYYEDFVVEHPFLFDGIAIEDLNDLIPENSGWELIEATAINDKGLIVGRGIINGEEHAFLMTPGEGCTCPPINEDVDCDQDGIVDAWECAIFQDLVQSATDDYDHDELSNLQEYQIGTDPTKWDTDGDGVSDGTEIAQGKNPLDPNDQGPCLEITGVTAKDTETGDIPTSGRPAKVEVTIKNVGGSASGDRQITPFIFSIDVKNEECDLLGGDWNNNEKLIQAENYPAMQSGYLLPGEQVKFVLDYTFVNACFTNRLRAILVSNDGDFLCSNSALIQRDLSPFRPYPNPDAFLNCYTELLSFIVFPLIGPKGLNLADQNEILALKAIKIKGINEYGIFKALKDKDFKTAGEKFVRYLWDTISLGLEMSGKAAVSKIMAVFKSGIDEWNNRGCGEALPDIWATIRDFIKGAAKAIKDLGYKMWSFSVGSPVNIEVVDSQGNVIYVDRFGVVSNTIPDSEGFIIKNGTENPIKSVLINGDGPYTVNLYGMADGTGSFHFIQPQNNGGLVSIDLDNIPFTANTQASINISDQTGNYLLLIDQNSDGIIDQTMRPTSIEIIEYGDSDGDGLKDNVDNCPNIYNPDQLDSNSNGIGDACDFKKICSYLGNNPKPSIPDIDIFKFSGTKGETVKIRIEANPPEAGSGKRVTLILTDKIRGTVLIKLDRSMLPNEIAAKLPATGEYLITVAEQVLTSKDKRYKGDYCLTLKATPATYQTLAPYLRVE